MLLEQLVKISDFVILVWEGNKSLPVVFNHDGWAHMRKEAWELVSYIDIVVEFYKQLGGANPDDNRAIYTQSLREEL